MVRTKMMCVIMGSVVPVTNTSLLCLERQWRWRRKSLTTEWRKDTKEWRTWRGSGSII